MDPQKLGEVIGQHLAEIFSGACTLTQEEVNSYADEPLAAQVLGGLYLLNEELHAREQARAQALSALHAALDRVRTLAEQLSTPIIKLRRDVLLMPLIGTLDDRRAQLMVEKGLDAVRAQRARTIILDVTGLTEMNTNVAGYLCRFSKALRLLGSQTLLAGISKEMAMTLVNSDRDLRELQSTRDLETALLGHFERLEPLGSLGP